MFLRYHFSLFLFSSDHDAVATMPRLSENRTVGTDDLVDVNERVIDRRLVRQSL